MGATARTCDVRQEVPARWSKAFVSGYAAAGSVCVAWLIPARRCPRGRSPFRSGRTRPVAAADSHSPDDGRASPTPGRDPIPVYPARWPVEPGRTRQSGRDLPPAKLRRKAWLVIRVSCWWQAVPPCALTRPTLAHAIARHGNLVVLRRDQGDPFAVAGVAVLAGANEHGAEGEHGDQSKWIADRLDLDAGDGH